MEFIGFTHGMGIGGWLTNYKRFNVLPQELRKVLSPGDFEHFETYITRRDIDYIAELGMDHIRLGFDQIVLEEKPGVYRENILRILDRFIQWCEDAGLNIVLNLHKAVGNYCDIKEDISLMDSQELQERFIALWLRLEDRFRNKPDIAFELLNEVRDVDPNIWNSLAEKVIQAIRNVNRNRKIIVGGIRWNLPSSLGTLKVYDDPNVIYTFHCYAPHEFTHQQGVLQPAQLYYNRAMPYPGNIERYRDYHRFVNGIKEPYKGLTVMDKGFLRKALAPAFEFVNTHPDKILWCGEFGTIRHCRIEYRENYMRDVISLLKEYGISYCVWNYLSMPSDGNRFSLVDDDTRKILSGTMGRIIRGDV